MQIWFARAHCFASGEGCSSGGKVVLAPGPPPLIRQCECGKNEAGLTAQAKGRSPLARAANIDETPTYK